VDTYVVFIHRTSILMNLSFASLLNRHARFRFYKLKCPLVDVAHTMHEDITIVRTL
jgi:hypothetical protein